MATTPPDDAAALAQRLAATQAEMQDFTYRVSHDLRAPLRHIVSYVQLVQEDTAGQLNAEVAGFLDTIAASARHMGALLDGLTALSRLGTVAVTPTAVPLLPLVQDVCAELALPLGARAVQWHIAPNLPTVQADAALLRQALVQVLDNAVKFTAPRALALVSIQALADAPAQHVALEIADNGVGFNPALQSQLGQVFARLHSAQAFPGLGLGLALTRKIMQRLGGDMQMSGVLDGGCRVVLTLPLAYCAD